MNAELAEDTKQLRETLERMKSKLETWFKAEVRRGANWLGRSRAVILAGTKLAYIGGKVEFEFAEINYD